MNYSIFETQHYDELSALIAIAELGSFAEAGRRLYRHPSVLSKRIAALEARLGVRLIERSTRKLKLTEAGGAFLERIKCAAQILEEAEQEVGQLSSSVTGVLRLSLPGAMGRLWLQKEIAAFANSYPTLTVNVDYSDNYVDVVSEGYDACIRIGTLQDSRLIAKRLCDHNRILCASPSYLEKYGVPEHPSDLIRHNCLGHTGLKTYPEWRLSQHGTEVNVITRGTFISNDGEALLEAARQGIGILGASNWLLAKDIINGKLVQLLSGWHFDKQSAIYLITPSTKFTPLKTTVFKNWIENAFKNGGPWGAYI